MRASFRLGLIASLAITPATAAGQLVSGVTFERGDPDHRVGVQLGGTLGVNLTSRLAMQFDASYVAFGKSPDVTYNTPCLPPSSGSPACGPVRVTGTRLMFAIGTVNLRFMEERDRNALYWIAGVGAYIASNDPTRLGWNVGGGLRLSQSVSVDLRYHQLLRSRSTRSLIPVTFGIRF
ncbi:MAG TPA: hypothetical protein VGQ06_14730 [Gemmatimonadales bacterium]|jgi:opacity protein-like surface antigen|nr:hypothetical protein [Gemmatimonadales bacterium]